jgi:hypothetical protein
MKRSSDFTELEPEIKRIKRLETDEERRARKEKLKKRALTPVELSQPAADPPAGPPAAADPPAGPPAAADPPAGPPAAADPQPCRFGIGSPLSILPPLPELPPLIEPLEATPYGSMFDHQPTSFLRMSIPQNCALVPLTALRDPRVSALEAEVAAIHARLDAMTKKY